MIGGNRDGVEMKVVDGSLADSLARARRMPMSAAGRLR